MILQCIFKRQTVGLAGVNLEGYLAFGCSYVCLASDEEKLNNKQVVGYDLTNKDSICICLLGIQALM